MQWCPQMADIALTAMHNLGVSTTRALSLVYSETLKIERPWYSRSNTAANASDSLFNDPRLAHMPEAMRRMFVEQYLSQSRDPDSMQEVSALGAMWLQKLA